jgi:hypothetical protein
LTICGRANAGGKKGIFKRYTPPFKTKLIKFSAFGKTFLTDIYPNKTYTFLIDNLYHSHSSDKPYSNLVQPIFFIST